MTHDEKESAPDLPNPSHHLRSNDLAAFDARRTLAQT